MSILTGKETVKSRDMVVPPGQTVTKKFPVFSYVPAPEYDPETWDFSVTGLVKKELKFTRSEFMKLPRVKVVSDMHCGTAWSRLGNEWEGVRVMDLLEMAGALPEARYVVADCDGGYTTNMALKDVMDEDVLLAHQIDGEDLTVEHGWPLRLVVPQLYAWKSAKWLRGLRLLVDDEPGYWEVRGYHNEANVWKEQRVWGN